MATNREPHCGLSGSCTHDQFPAAAETFGRRLKKYGIDEGIYLDMIMRNHMNNDAYSTYVRRIAPPQAPALSSALGGSLVRLSF